MNDPIAPREAPHAPRRRALLVPIAAAAFAFTAVLLGAFAWLAWRAGRPQPAPEAERVLAAQVDLPFQALLPAYLPAAFNRSSMKIKVESGASTQAAILNLVYTNRRGQTLTFTERLAPGVSAAPVAKAAGLGCPCCIQGAGCATNGSSTASGCGTAGCSMTGGLLPNERLIGRVQVQAAVSAPDAMTLEEFLLSLDTLGPAANSQVFSRPQDVPLSLNLPPAQPALVGSDGVQELTLVVTPEGYSPAHFSVEKGRPVRLTFRQLGEVGCGNELLLTWGGEGSAHLVLASPSDAQSVEFTPDKAGEFRFNCPHNIYRGVMAVIE